MKFFTFLASLVTDKDWDGDGAKFFGLALIIAGLVGFYLGKSDFQWVLGFGATMIGTGKWAEERGK